MVDRDGPLVRIDDPDERNAVREIVVDFLEDVGRPVVR
jgi:hypothetical protein